MISFPERQFNEADERARREGFFPAWSNESFELWYVLHFVYLDTALDRHQLNKKLAKCLGVPYTKNTLDMYDLLLSKQSDAIRNATRLDGSYPERETPSRKNPCMLVYRLVERLNQFSSS